MISVRIEKKDLTTKEWSEYQTLHPLQINKSGHSSSKGAEDYSSRAEQSKLELDFKFRYNPLLKKIAFNTQIYRILYDDTYFQIKDYDNYMEGNKTITLTGESYL